MQHFPNINSESQNQSALPAFFQVILDWRSVMPRELMTLLWLTLKCLWLQQFMIFISHYRKAWARCFDRSPIKHTALFVFKGPLYLVGWGLGKNSPIPQKGILAISCILWKMGEIPLLSRELHIIFLKDWVSFFPLPCCPYIISTPDGRGTRKSIKV